MGLPHNWARVKYWLNFNGKLKIPVKPLDKIIVKKCLEIAKLECYSVNPKDNFWKKFPVNPLPEKPVTTVNVEALKGRLKKVEDSLTWAQKYWPVKPLVQRPGGLTNVRPGFGGTDSIAT